MTLPNFLIIGAAKAGTTSLYHYLKQHPQVFMCPVKEPIFFALEGSKARFHGPGDQETVDGYSVTSYQDYCALFQNVSSETAIGEASTLYLYDNSSDTIKRLQHYVPDVKLISVLREPVERAYSHFLYMVGKHSEPLNDFPQALAEEEWRSRDNWWPAWHYKKMGFYYAQLKPFFDAFEPSQMAVYLYEDLVTDPSQLMRSLFEFLGVDETFNPDMGIHHNIISGKPKNKLLNDFLTKPNLVRTGLQPLLPCGWSKKIAAKIRAQNLSKPPLPLEVRKQLAPSYREDILKLQDLIERDLSHWLEY